VQKRMNDEVKAKLKLLMAKNPPKNPQTRTADASPTEGPNEVY